MLKQFRLEGVLGEGGMGLVHRAYDTRLHRTVAIKVLGPELTADPERKQRLLQEARAAARISHPAVAQVFDADEADGVTFIVMEFVEGKTVAQLILDGELDLLGAMDVGIHVADGLAKAHNLGIVHRDIKPANVMRTKDGHVKILDFGLAKLVNQNPSPTLPDTPPPLPVRLAQTQSGIVMGTPAYMSPEQVRGGTVDSRADIFGLGVLLFEMATGQSPFQRENFRQALRAVESEEAPPMISLRANIPEALQQIVSRFLRKRPDDRYQNAREVAEELRRIRRDTEAELAPKTSWQQRLHEAWVELRHRPASSYRWYALGLVGVVAVLYLLLKNVSVGTWFALALVSLAIYRRIRNRPQHMQELFVRRAAKIPEVRLVLFQEPQFTVVVDYAIAQLYGGLSDQLRRCNQKLYFGRPMTLSILHEVSADQFGRMLASAGVQYVREDVASGKSQ